MSWHAQLQLEYTFRANRTVTHHQHRGPLRILQSLYPEGDSICHNVLVHPPGGLVGGDTLSLNVNARTDSHGLITTPGATRFYKSLGDQALQHTKIKLDDGARLEWLPLESICHDGCLAENRLSMELAPSAEMMGWDVTALGLPHANQPFAHGSFCQHIELPGVWLEQGRMDANDKRLLDGPVGLAGHRCLASMFFVAGSALARGRRQAALDVAREVIESHALHTTAGVTSPNAQVVVVRALAPVVEPAMDLLRKIRGVWRNHFWNLSGANPRVWNT